MELTSIYKDMAARTGGNIYIGVVGPVRTGKSTFIKRFMNRLVIPNISDDFKRERALDELPQSGAGKTVMTAEPKFVPEEAVELTFGEATAGVRLIDCVGYMIPGALGQFENDMPRMVMTPWSDEEMPMVEAAEMGTKKVILDHSTIGVLVTTDGSITEIPRGDYEEAEARVAGELKTTGKPWIIVVNSTDPKSEGARGLAAALSEKYGVAAVSADVMNMEEPEIGEILRSVLYEFPLRTVDIFLPRWFDSLEAGHWLRENIYNAVTEASAGLKKVRDIESAGEVIGKSEFVSSCAAFDIKLGKGSAGVEIDIGRDVFYKIVYEDTGFELSDEGALLPMLRELAGIKKSWKRVESAMEEVENKGYGIVFPGLDELRLEPPSLVRQGNRFGVKLTASAPSIHIIRAEINTTVSPIVGSEKQSEELVESLLREFEGSEEKIWESNIFGKSLHDLVNEGLGAKLNHMPEDARMKYRETLERIINEGSSGLICIIL